MNGSLYFILLYTYASSYIHWTCFPTRLISSMGVHEVFSCYNVCHRLSDVDPGILFLLLAYAVLVLSIFTIVLSSRGIG